MKLFATIFFMVLFSTPSQALEVTASSSVDTAVNSISNSYQKLNSNYFKKIMVCQSQLKFYAPAHANADADGCVAVEIPETETSEYELKEFCSPPATETFQHTKMQGCPDGSIPASLYCKIDYIFWGGGTVRGYTHHGQISNKISSDGKKMSCWTQYPPYRSCAVCMVKK